MKHVRINLYTNDTESHPAGVRGLKHDRPRYHRVQSSVAPRRGAWIETQLTHSSPAICPCRTPQGCVD